MDIGADDGRQIRMYLTNIDLSANIRAASALLLNARLADAIDLATQLKHAHWNIHGPHFRTLHLLFDELHDEVDAQADLMAERVASFGETAQGTLLQVVASSSIPAYPEDAKSERTHLEALAAAFAIYCGHIRRDIQTSADAGDAGTADIFTEISRAADRQLWKLEAHFRPAR
jgi:starvation-inducible DNA-binding protein